VRAASSTPTPDHPSRYSVPPKRRSNIPPRCRTGATVHWACPGDRCIESRSLRAGRGNERIVPRPACCPSTPPACLLWCQESVGARPYKARMHMHAVGRPTQPTQKRKADGNDFIAQLASSSTMALSQAASHPGDVRRPRRRGLNGPTKTESRRSTRRSARRAG